MTRTSKALLLVCLPALLGFSAWLIRHELHTPQNQGEALDRMIELQKQGRYDKAASVMQTWLKDPRRNTSHDGFLYGQIAFVYIVKAYKKPASRDESLHQAELNLEIERSLIKNAPFDLMTDLFQIGGSYEILGDLSESNKCRYYTTARNDLELQLPLIQGDTYTTGNQTFSLEPLRQDVNKHLDSVKEKALRAGCSVVPGNG